MNTSLHEVFQHQAAEAPDAAPVLAKVHAGLRRRRRHRATALTTGSALAVGGLICAAVLIPRHTDTPTATVPSATAQESSMAPDPTATQSSPESLNANPSTTLATIEPAPVGVALSLTRVPAGYVYLGQAAQDTSAWGPAGTALSGGFSNKLVAYTAMPESAPANFTNTAAGYPAAVLTSGAVTTVVLQLKDVHAVLQFPVDFKISASEALAIADSLDVRRVAGGGVG